MPPGSSARELQGKGALVLSSPALATSLLKLAIDGPGDWTVFTLAARPARVQVPDAGRARNLQVATHGDAIFATWRERDEAAGHEHIHVARYLGTDWEHLGAPCVTEASNTHVEMTLDEDGRPVLAIERLNDSLETELHVIRRAGTDWLALGARYYNHVVIGS